VPPGVYGVMTHFWIATGGEGLANTIIRYYADGEVNSSIAFQPAMASGVGFNDFGAPWGIKWMGKAATGDSWFHNIKIPFQKNIRVTWQSANGTENDNIFIIVRGDPNIPIDIGGVVIPQNARMHLISQSKRVKPLGYLNIVNIDQSRSGLFFFITMAVVTRDIYAMEGCIRFFSPPNQPFPGTLLSTGTEDYFDSASFFSAGDFYFPNSGFTHWGNDSGKLMWSAYRFHEEDPLQFSQGLRFVWRNGDVTDPATELKCFIEEGGSTIGTLSDALVSTYSWVYIW